MKSQTTPSKIKANLLLDEQLCFALYSTSLAMNKVYRQALTKLDLTYPQYLVLMVLWEKDEQSVSEIGEKLFLDSATLTPLLKRMEAAGYIARARLPADERVVMVTLTANGKKLKPKLEAVWEQVGCSMGCTLSEVKELKARLETLRDNLLKNAE
jgi:DNA-binding MarR family transcriptional regulator